MSQFAIRPYAYTDEDAAKLAVMWNESDDQWPGTFSHGVPFTAERVREWMAREAGLANLVVEDPSNERIVGYGSLWEEQDREKTCYVAVLNVQPAYQGKSLARRMLVQMLDLAVDLGYRLMTIGTWPGNLKSVPLYKKVGFFWMPDTSVFMENFIPLIRQLPVARGFFQRHDWYATLRRDLRQVEDDETHGSMRVYHYRWEAADESLLVLVDREAKAVTGVETERFAAYAELDQTEPVHSLPYPIRWRVINKESQPVNLSVLASSVPGIQITHQSACLLLPGEERTITGRFIVLPDIRPVKKSDPAPAIKTVLVIGGDVLELGTGVRPRPAVSVSVEPSPPVLLPGRPQTVRVQLSNNLDRPLEGIISLSPEAALDADWTGLRHSFSLDARGYAGLPLTVTCHLGAPSQATQAVPLLATAHFQLEGTQVHTRPQRIPLLAMAPGGMAADLGIDGSRMQAEPAGAEGEVITAQNEFFRLTVRPEGGVCELWDTAGQRPIAAIRDELGPPFVPSELWFRRYELSLEQGDGRVKAILAARSRNFPGVTLYREMTISASPLIELRHRVTNDGPKVHTVQLSPRIQFREVEGAVMTVPRTDRLVSERAALFGNTEGDVPKQPARLAERWLAWRVGTFCAGLIWGPDVEEHRWEWNRFILSRAPVTLEPDSTLDFPPVHIYAGPGDWSDVRRIWTRLSPAGAREPSEHPSRPAVRVRGRPSAALEFGFVGSGPDQPGRPVLALGSQVRANLRVSSLRELPLDGRLVIDPPAGWLADPSEFTFSELKQGNSLEATVRFTSDADRIGAYDGRLHLESTYSDATKPFTIIRLGDETVAVAVQQLDEQRFQMDNGQSRWEIVAGYHAGVVSWTSGESNTNHLRTAYPQEGGASMGWLRPWFGGIHPYLPPPGLDEEGWPGKLHEERFSVQACQQADERGVLWRGLCLTAELARKEFRGMQAEVEYLTVGRSNLLKVVYRLVNKTAVYRRAEPGLLAFFQVDGRHDNSVLHGEGVHRKRTPVMAWPQVHGWGAVQNPDSGRALVLVSASGKDAIELSDWGPDGGHLFCRRDFILSPHSQQEITVYLALSGSLEEAQRYAALTGAAPS